MSEFNNNIDPRVNVDIDMSYPPIIIRLLKLLGKNGSGIKWSPDGLCLQITPSILKMHLITSVRSFLSKLKSYGFYNITYLSDNKTLYYYNQKFTQSSQDYLVKNIHAKRKCKKSLKNESKIVPFFTLCSMATIMSCDILDMDAVSTGIVGDVMDDVMEYSTLTDNLDINLLLDGLSLYSSYYG